MNRLFPLRANTQDYASFLKEHRRFMMYGYIAYETDWLIPQLLQDGAQLRLIQRQPDQFGMAALFEVQMPDSASSVTQVSSLSEFP